LIVDEGRRGCFSEEVLESIEGLLVIVSKVSEDLSVLLLICFPVIDGLEASETFWGGGEYLKGKVPSLFLE